MSGSIGRIHRALLRLLPPGFRARFGDQMRDMLESRARERASQTVARRRVLACLETWDLLRTIVREWARTIGKGPPPWRALIEPMRVTDVRDDVKLALRTMGRHPVFSAIVIVTLALGVGANTATFSVVDTMVLRALPYPGADRLVHLRVHDTRSGSRSPDMAYADFQEFRDEVDAFDALAGYSNQTYIHSGAGITPRRIKTAGVTNGFFDVIGVRPMLGRTFAPNEHDEQNRRYLVMSHSFWAGAYGSDASVVGSAIIVDEVEYEVIGVMPPGFDYPHLTEMEGWTPLADRAFVMDDTTSAFSERDWTTVSVVGRLADGTSLARAQAEVDALSSAVAQAYPRTNATLRHEVVPLQALETAGLRRPLLLTLAAVAAILFVACVNVASLLLARGTARGPEVALRVALGAGRGRLVRLFLVESVLYAVAGGLGGILLGAWLLEMLPSLGITAPRLGHVRLDLRVLSAVVTVTLVTGIAFGLLPALRGSRLQPASDLRKAGRGGRIGAARIQRTLVAFELAATTVLAVAAGLLVSSLAQTLDEDPGFDPTGVLTMRLSLPTSYMSDPVDHWADSNAFFDELTERVRALPGVVGVGLSFTNPLEPSRAFDNPVEIPGWLERPRPEQPMVNVRPADPGFFDVFSIPLVSGRLIGPADRKDTEGVAVINDAFRRLIFGDEDPIGHAITGPNFWGFAGYPYPWRIVGVVGDVRSAGLASDPAPAMYLPVTQAPMGNMRLVVKTAGAPEALVSAVQSAVWAIDGQVPVDELQTMVQAIDDSVSTARLAAAAVGVFALLALVLASVGVYGVLSYSVGLRSAEFGVRQALGARSDDILRLVVGQGLGTATLGIAAGLAVAAWGSQLIETFLYGVRPVDFTTYLLVSVILLGSATIACLVPARRATRVDPAVILRDE